MAIKVVSFVNEDIVQNEDLNSIMTLPNRLKELSDTLKDQFINELKTQYPKDTDWFDLWVHNFYWKQNQNDRLIISNYIESNINDLYRTSVIWFLDNFFGIIYQTDNWDNTLYDFPLSIFDKQKEYYTMERFENIHSLPMNNLNEITPSIIYVSLDQFADLYITRIVKTYDEIIQNKLIYIMNNRRINEFYKDWYKKVYNESPTNWNADYIYTFCISLLREQAENEIIKIRKAMTLVMGNAAEMYYQSLLNTQNNKKGGKLLEE